MKTLKRIFKICGIMATDNNIPGNWDERGVVAVWVVSWILCGICMPIYTHCPIHAAWAIGAVLVPFTVMAMVIASMVIFIPFAIVWFLIMYFRNAWGLTK